MALRAKNYTIFSGQPEPGVRLSCIRNKDNLDIFSILSPAGS